jgi:dTDP-4-dehydrorhamnose 3,5-epimerase
LKIEELKIPGVLLMTPKVFRDERGYFMETHRWAPLAEFLAKESKIGSFVQGNLSSSIPNVLRGLHYQLERPQGKLVRCLKGRIYDVAVDIRKGSPTFGKWLGVHLDEQNAQAIYVPPGFAHGFLAGPQGALVHYECTTEYVDAWNRAIRWNDPDLHIAWGLPQAAVPVLSQKDRGAPTLADAVAKGDIFEYGAVYELIEQESRLGINDLADVRRVPRHGDV